MNLFEELEIDFVREIEWLTEAASVDNVPRIHLSIYVDL